MVDQAGRPKALELLVLGSGRRPRYHNGGIPPPACNRPSDVPMLDPLQHRTIV